MQRIGRYELGEKLGAGGMGVVYRGRDTKLGREVAIKTIQFDRQTCDSDTTRIERFNVEAQAVARLAHPNIVSIHDIAEEAGVAYIVMELVSGRDLYKVLESGPLSPDDAVPILLQAAAALDHAHDNGVFHRDVKPANLMLRGDGTVKLMDFGIAKVGEVTGLTQTGNLVGTMQYIAPEILRMEDCRRESDQYSLGVIAFEMLAGKRPFDSNTPQAIAAAVLALPAPSICMAKPLLPQTLDPVFARVLDKDPASRYRSCTEFVQALADAVTNGLAAAESTDFDAPYRRFGHPPEVKEPAKKVVEPLFDEHQPLHPEPSRGRGGISWTTAAIAFVLLAEGAWLVHRHVLSPPEPPPQETAQQVQAPQEARRETQPAEASSAPSIQPEPTRVTAPPPAPARSSASDLPKPAAATAAPAAVATPAVPDAARQRAKGEMVAAGRRIVIEMLPCFQGKASPDCWPKAKPHVSSLVSTLTALRDGRRMEFEELGRALDQDPASQSSIVKLIVESRRLLDDSGETDLP